MLDPVAKRAHVALLGVLGLWSFGPALSKMITATPGAATFYRMPIGFCFHVVLLLLVRQRLTLDALRRTWLPGLLMIVNMVSFFGALRHASVANLVLVASLQTPLTMLAAAAFFGERVRRWDVAWTGVALLGIALAITASDSGSKTRTTPLGLALALLSTVAFTAYFFISKQARSTVEGQPRLSPIVFMTGVMLWGTVGSTIYGLVVERGNLREFERADFFWATVVAIVPSSAHLLVSWCHAHVPIRISALVLLVQPMTAAAVSWPINGQPLRPLQIVGGLVVVGAVGAIVMRQMSGSAAAVPATAVPAAAVLATGVSAGPAVSVEPAGVVVAPS